MLDPPDLGVALMPSQSRPRRATASALVFALVVLLLGVAGVPAGAQAAPCDPPVTNPVACENTRPGNPASEWDVAGAGSNTIQGFTTDISADQGGTVRFKIDTPSTNYRLDIYRMGYYGGSGARRVATVQPSAALPQDQPDCLYESSTGLTDCGNWAESASWAVPADAVSGIYFAKLVREDGTAGSSHVVFVVRDDDGGSDLLFQTSDTTWQAYNDYGGNSLYRGQPAGRAYAVSYNRPFVTRGCCSEDWVFNAEYPMVRWIEANGYDVSYTTNVDTERRGGELQEHEAFLSVGHDEYWSAGMRANVEAARGAGVHLAFFSGNEVFWKTRWRTSIDGSGTPHRTLVSYKETHAGAKIDPDPAWTGTWRDPRFSPPSDGGRPENALTGQIFTVNCCPGALTMQVPQAEGRLRLWRNTDIANLPAGGVATLSSNTLNYEWDEDLDNGARPPGLMRLSSATYSGVPKLQDHGSSYASGTATHSITLYRHASGALVFGAGTVQWSWGLDNNHDRQSSSVDVRMRQATVNLFADMRVQPRTLQPGLVAATASTDTAPASSTITSPASGAQLNVGTAVTISGTATDTGGRVGGVEVSVDGGTTWRRANGRESWTYSWTPSASGTPTIRSRAVDDSGNLESPSAGVTVTVGTGQPPPPPPPPGTCPCSIWDGGVTPGTVQDPDAVAIELGVRFRASVNGFITGVRFYKGPANTGTHVGSLWSNTGAQLATATFTGETASGWQQVSFASPVAVTAGTTYVASYHAPVGRYSVDDDYFASSGVDRGPLRALANGEDGANGVYRYGTSGFPTSSYRSSNYWVDVVFETSGSDTAPPTVTARSPSPGATGVAVAANVTATFSEPVSSVGMSLSGPGGAVPAAVSYDAASRTSTLNPGSDLAASTSYTATVSSATDTAGNPLAGPITWTFTTAATPPADTTPPTVTARSPSPGATGVAAAANVTATFSEPVGSVAMSLSGPGGVLPAVVSYDAASRTATLNPNNDLAASTSYTATVSSATDASGNPLAAPVTWTFTTAASPPPPGSCPCSIWSSVVVPGTVQDPERNAVELGVRFRASVDGFITGVRFYKGPNNTGTHVGSLWSSLGTRLATATFTGETASGWQQVSFASPVAVTAGTVYVASYHAPVGRYAINQNFFASAGVDSGPLRALQNGEAGGSNGVYRYGASSFPNLSYRSSNYWVDVVFETSP